MLRQWPSTRRGRRQVPPKRLWLSRFPHTSASSEQFSFPWRKPRNNVSHPEKPQPGSLSVAAGEASCVAKRNEPTHNTVKHDLTYELTKTKQKKTKQKRDTWWSAKIFPVLPITGQKLPPQFAEYSTLFAVFQHFYLICLFMYLFIPRFLARPLTMFCGL